MHHDKVLRWTWRSRTRARANTRRCRCRATPRALRPKRDARELCRLVRSRNARSHRRVFRVSSPFGWPACVLLRIWRVILAFIWSVHVYRCGRLGCRLLALVLRSLQALFFLRQVKVVPSKESHLWRRGTCVTALCEMPRQLFAPRSAGGPRARFPLSKSPPRKKDAGSATRASQDQTCPLARNLH